MKLCNKCKLNKEDSCFAKLVKSIDGLGTYCKSCTKEYRNANIKKHSAHKKKKMVEIQSEGIKEYGSKCVCCGEHRPKFLTIDHINNDGASERRELNHRFGNKQRYTGKKLWALLKSLGYPKDRYRLLCFNCNSGRHINGGICPHEEERNMTLIVNLCGGPGCGKSTTAAGTFCELKQQGINCELVTEYAKDRVWDNHLDCLDDQIYMFGKQFHRIKRLIGKVDVIVTDAPLIMSIYYGANNTPVSFRQLVLDMHRSFDNLNIFLKRSKPYNPSGRLQTEEGAKEIDVELKGVLDNHQVKYYDVDANRSAPVFISRLVLNKLDNTEEKMTYYKDGL